MPASWIHRFSADGAADIIGNSVAAGHIGVSVAIVEGMTRRRVHRAPSPFGRRDLRPRSFSPENHAVSSGKTMKTDELREKYLAFFETKGCVRRPERRARAPLGPLGAVHARRHEPVQGPLPRPVQARVHPGDDLPEVPAHRRHRQRRPDGLPPHVLRDAGQLQLRRLLQARGDPLGLGVSDRARSGSASTRAALGHRLSRRRRGGRHLARRHQAAAGPDRSGWARTRTSGRPAPRARGPTASAARAAKSTTTPTSARSRSGTWCSRSSTAWAIRRTTCGRCRARTSTRAWAWSGRPPCCRASRRTSTSTSSARWSRRPARSAA